MEYKLLVETSNPADVALIKSLLDSEEILYFVHGEAFSAVRPLVEPVRFLVAEDRLEDAKNLIASLRLAYGPTAPPRAAGGDDPDD